MYLKHLNLINYRNVENLNIEFDKKYTIFHGDNAQGKTNIIESIYLFGYLKSFRQYKNIDLIGPNYNETSITSCLNDTYSDYKYNIKISKNNKKIYINNNSINNNECFKYLKSIIYFTDELNVLRNSNTLRRNYIDRGIFLNDKSYLNLVNRYLFVIKSRNTLLKKNKIKDLDVWTDLLVEIGTEIRIKRYNYILEINKIIENIYRKIFNNLTFVHIENSDFSLSVDTLKNKFHTSLLNKRNYEISYGKTLVGPHLDKFDFLINNKNARFYGSQGELRALLFSLKFSQIFLHKKIFDEFPIFLIDDISSEIDDKKLCSLFDFMDSELGQIIITTTNNNFINFDKYKKKLNYKIVDGHIK